MSRIKTIMIIVLAVATIHAAAELTQADVYTFYNITNNSNVDVAGQLLMDVSDADSNQVLFTFTNIGPIASSITDIYFDDGSLLGIASLDNSHDGVAFSQLASPTNLPGASNVSPPFVTTSGFSADSDPPVPSNGIEIGSDNEWLGILFNLQDTHTFADVISELSTGALRVGLHVQSIDGAIPENEDSDSLVAVPVPGAAILGVIGLGLVGWLKRRTGKAAVA